MPYPDILALRPFLPATNYEHSIAFYQALGFAILHRDPNVTIFTAGAFGFILQNIDLPGDNLMVQLMVQDADAWWNAHAIPSLATRFAVKPPIAPTLQHWGLRVGFVFDPSGILWHISEPPPA